jgi:hypothetical protein
MTKGCAAVTKAKQIAVVAERKLVRVLSGSSCVVIRSGQVGTDALRGAPGGAASCLAWRSAGRAQPSLFDCSHDWYGVERADLLELAGDGWKLASRISCSGQFGAPS